jgi:hypothetical protein
VSQLAADCRSDSFYHKKSLQLATPSRRQITIFPIFLGCHAMESIPGCQPRRSVGCIDSVRFVRERRQFCSTALDDLPVTSGHVVDSATSGGSFLAFALIIVYMVSPALKRRRFGVSNELTIAGNGVRGTPKWAKMHERSTEDGLTLTLKAWETNVNHDFYHTGDGGPRFVPYYWDDEGFHLNERYDEDLPLVRRRMLYFCSGGPSSFEKQDHKKKGVGLRVDAIPG